MKWVTHLSVMLSCLFLDPSCLPPKHACDPYFTDIPTGRVTLPGEALGLEGGEVELRVSRLAVIAEFEDGSFAIYTPAE